MVKLIIGNGNMHVYLLAKPSQFWSPKVEMTAQAYDKVIEIELSPDDCDELAGALQVIAGRARKGSD